MCHILAAAFAAALLVHALYVAGLLVCLAATAGYIAAAAEHRHVVTQLQQVLTTDELTGLPNRAAITSAISQMTAHSTDVVVGFGDLDQFKALNDTYGHDTGDQALRHIADVLRQQLPRLTVGRIHGDEFVFAWYTTDGLTEAAHVIAVLDSHPLILADGRAVRLSMSIGIARHSRGTGPSLLMHRADLAMHRAKEHSARVAVYDPDDAVDCVPHRPIRRVRDTRPTTHPRVPAQAGACTADTRPGI